MTIFGLIGRSISYSFSVKYFTDKFKSESITDVLYKNFDIPDITYLSQVIKKNKNLKGLNVTIPYKQDVIPYLDKLSYKAEIIGAVNCIKITKKGKLKGYNTDAYGFKKSLKPLLRDIHTKALILGTGGASKAIAFVFDELNIDYKFVSRTEGENRILYSQVNKDVLNEYLILVNCTPIGTFPEIDLAPEINYELLTNQHIVYDLVYNPEETKFLRLAKQKGAAIKNGYDMLVFQAEKAWKIWNK